jgi:hypothetical protein
VIVANPPVIGRSGNAMVSNPVRQLTPDMSATIITHPSGAGARGIIRA